MKVAKQAVKPTTKRSSSIEDEVRLYCVREQTREHLHVEHSFQLLIFDGRQHGEAGGRRIASSLFGQEGSLPVKGLSHARNWSAAGNLAQRSLCLPFEKHES